MIQNFGSLFIYIYISVFEISLVRLYGTSDNLLGQNNVDDQLSGGQMKIGIFLSFL